MTAEADTERRRPWIDEQRLVARNQNRSTVVCQQGMVCASQPLATMVGIDILKAGGNCIDAAIATNAMLGLTEPASNGIGGDLFAICWIEREQKLFGLNASGRAPANWNLSRAAERHLKFIPRISPLSWSVPGCVSGWSALSSRFGKLGLTKCLAPAIEYATSGFPISPLIASHFRFPASYDESLKRLYYTNGEAPGYGDILKNPELANSYRQIAAGGAEAFYRGEIAQRVSAKARDMGGYLSAQDLADHTADWVEPVSTNYRGWDVWQIPPNGQGIAVLQMLNLLETFDIGDLQPNSAEHLHLFVEAKKLAFEDRARYYADPKFADVPIAQLISKEYARKRAANIRRDQANRAPRAGDPALDSDTVYLTAADEEGNMISFIQSLYNGFGSTICPDGVGFSIQNRGQAFSLAPDHRNRLEPQKRPFHTIIPGFVTQGGRPIMSYGVMGGDFQPQGHCQVLMNMIDFGMSPQQAGEQPRIAHTGSQSPWNVDEASAPAEPPGGSLEIEAGVAPETIARLIELGHTPRKGNHAHGGYQAIWREENPRRYFGGSDPRKDGCAIGY
ncbi:MAG: gamma-glutamyltransferase [Planctomycetales bacterium]|nr:gamma-glutamyltransferase [Planctomycetales bacterium]